MDINFISPSDNWRFHQNSLMSLSWYHFENPATVGDLRGCSLSPRSDRLQTAHHSLNNSISFDFLIVLALSNIFGYFVICLKNRSLKKVFEGFLGGATFDKYCHY